MPDGLPTSILEQEHHPGRSNSHAVCSRPAESQVIQSIVVTYSSMKLPGLVMQDSQGWTRLRHRRYLLTQALRLQKCTYCRRHCGPSKFSRLEDERTLSRCKRLRWLGWCSTYYKADCLSARYARDERPESDLSTLGTTMTLRQRSISSRIGLLASQALEHHRMVSIAVCFVLLLELTRLCQQIA